MRSENRIDPAPARSSLPRLVAGLLTALLVALPALAAAQAQPQLRVSLKKSYLLELGETVETVSITDTEIADFVVAAKTQVLIHGKREGSTSLVVWTQGGRHKSYDLIVQRGPSPKQVLLNVRVAEVVKSKLTEFGVDYLLRQVSSGEDRAAGIYPGGIGKPAIPLAAGSLPEFTDDASIALRYIKGSDDFEVLLHALQQRGLLKVIARPNLVCVDGKEASFLAGGEIPIPVAQTSSVGGTVVTIEWREFGARLYFLPTVVDSNLIHLKVEPEVSSLDYANAILIGGYVVPALRSRKAATEVELKENESLVIGGLEQTAKRDVNSRIPILGDIPLLGYLFRKIETQVENTELLIVVSPRVVTPMPSGTGWSRPETLPPNGDASNDWNWDWDAGLNKK
jgi:pilus assembly protein CpaC